MHLSLYPDTDRVIPLKSLPPQPEHTSDYDRHRWTTCICLISNCTITACSQSIPCSLRIGEGKHVYQFIAVENLTHGLFPHHKDSFCRDSSNRFFIPRFLLRLQEGLSFGIAPKLIPSWSSESVAPVVGIGMGSLRFAPGRPLVGGLLEDAAGCLKEEEETRKHLRDL
jgi:hypothetical protein